MGGDGNTVNVLLSTFNGGRFLPELLGSLYAQRDVTARILVRDDGSTDATRSMLEREERAGRLRWYGGENLGPAKSFMELLSAAPPGDFYAFCDQDDVWLPNKLARALAMLGEDPSDRPALYYGRPTLTDAALRPLRPVPRAMEMMTSFGAALIASNATGCTMVFNRALREMLISRPPDWLFMHDDWAHKVCLLAGGRLVFDPEVPILYRQHTDNCIGTPPNAPAALRAQLARLRRRERLRSRTAASLLECFGDRMAPEDRQLAEEAARYGEDLASRLRLCLDGRVRTGYPARDLLFRLAVIMKAY